MGSGRKERWLGEGGRRAIAVEFVGLLLVIDAAGASGPTPEARLAALDEDQLGGEKPLIPIDEHRVAA